MAETDDIAEKIADMLEQGYGIAHMSIPDIDRLNTVLEGRGVDLSKQSFVNANGEFCLVSDLDQVWFNKGQDVLSLSGAFSQCVIPPNREDLQGFDLTADQWDHVDIIRQDIRDNVSTKRAEYDKNLQNEGVMDMLTDASHPDYMMSAYYVQKQLKDIEEDITRYARQEFTNYPEAFKERFVADELDNLRQEAWFYYDIADQYQLKEQAMNEDAVTETMEDVILSIKDVDLSRFGDVPSENTTVQPYNVVKPNDFKM